MTDPKIDPYALTIEEFDNLNEATQYDVRRQGYEALSTEAFAYLDSTGKQWVVYCGNPPKVAMEGQDIREPTNDVLRILGKAHGSLPWVFSAGTETGEIDVVELPIPTVVSSSTIPHKLLTNDPPPSGVVHGGCTI